MSALSSLYLQMSYQSQQQNIPGNIHLTSISSTSYYENKINHMHSVYLHHFATKRLGWNQKFIMKTTNQSQEVCHLLRKKRKNSEISFKIGWDLKFYKHKILYTYVLRRRKIKIIFTKC